MADGGAASVHLSSGCVREDLCVERKILSFAAYCVVVDGISNKGMMDKVEINCEEQHYLVKKW